jgi:hypothetical protein
MELENPERVHRESRKAPAVMSFEKPVEGKTKVEMNRWMGFR